MPDATPADLLHWNQDPKHLFGMKWQYKSSSALPRDGSRTYDAKNAFDGNLDTAWCFHEKGAWVEICNTNDAGLNSDTDLKAFGVVPGYAKSSRLLTDNGRITRLRLVDVYQPEKSVTLEIKSPPEKDSEALRIFGELRSHYASPQLEPLKSIFHGLHRCLKIEVLDFVAGKKSKDACISEIIPQFRWDE